MAQRPWQPPTDEIIVERWTSRYPEAKKDRLKELATLKLILMNTEYGTKVLETVQKGMKVGQSLDDYLATLEQQQGFQYREVVKDVLGRDKFQAYLQAAQHLLDCGVPADHGPYTHRLQWCIVYQAHAEHKITTSPVELYKELGKPEFRDATMETRTIWDDTFDYDQEAQNVLLGSQQNFDLHTQGYPAFSSPEWTLPYLISSQFSSGTLQQELRLTRFRQAIVDDKESILDFAAALRGAIVERKLSLIRSQTNFNDMESVSRVGKELQAVDKQQREELKNKNLEELETLYNQTVNSNYFVNKNYYLSHGQFPSRQ